MLGNLFVNSVILVAAFSLGTQVFREKPLLLSKSLKSKILSGILTGLLGCLLMRYCVYISSNAILDLRSIPIIVSSVYFGLVPSIITGIVIGLFRVLYFGLSIPSVVGLLIAIITGTGCGLISLIDFSQRKKWTCSVIYSLITGSIGFIVSIKVITVLIVILIHFWIATILMSTLIYFYIQYLFQSGNLYRRYRDELKIDFLTGLNNVRQFDNVFNEIIRKLKVNESRSLSLLYIDIDHFKKVNDTYGHSQGDLVLKEFSIILTATCRDIDLIFRNGGEEFSVILLDYNEINAVELAERIRRDVQIHKFKLLNGGEFSITASIGVSSYPDTAKDMDTLLEEADRALYTAKRTGRNKVAISELQAKTFSLQ